MTMNESAVGAQSPTESDETLLPSERRDLEALRGEPSALDRLFGAIDSLTTRYTIPVRRLDPANASRYEVVLTFEIEVGGDAEIIDKAQRLAATKWSKTSRGGKRDVEDFDVQEYRKHLIYLASTAETKAALWDNRAVWQKYNCLTGTDVIEKALRPGERQDVQTIIHRALGFGDRDESDESEETALGN